MSTDETLVERVAYFMTVIRERKPNLEYLYKFEHGSGLTPDDVDELLAECARKQRELNAALEGMQRLQTMNEGLRQMAIEAREAAEGWHRATIDLYSGRDEPHPADCPCGRQESCAVPQRPERGHCPCDCPSWGTDGCGCTDPCPCKPCRFCDAPLAGQQPERGGDAGGAE